MFSLEVFNRFTVYCFDKDFDPPVLIAQKKYEESTCVIS